MMNSDKITLFTIGYADNTMTRYLLEYFINRGVQIDGVIFIRNKLKRDWKRLLHKMRMRGWKASLKRIFENLLLRKSEILKIAEKHFDKVFFVDEVNSDEVKDILISNQVDLLILTSTPIIKKKIISIEGLILLNAHTGWLPQYRGLDANLKAMRDGQPLGVSVHKVTKKIDGGEIYLREQFSIEPNGKILEQMDAKELELSGKLLVDTIHLMQENKLRPIAQSEPLGRYEPVLTKHERKRIVQQNNY